MDDADPNGDVLTWKGQIASLQRIVQEKDELIASLRVKLAAMKSQLEVQKRLLQAERTKSDPKAAEMAATFVNDVELDNLTQTWLATELANPSHSQYPEDDDEDEMSDSESDRDTISELEPDDQDTFAQSRRWSMSQKSGSEPSILENPNPNLVSIHFDPGSPVGSDGRQKAGGDISRAQSIISLKKSMSSESHDQLSAGFKKLRSVTSWRGKKNMSGSLPPEPSPKIPVGALDELRRFEFDAFSKSQDDLIRLVVYIYQDLHLLDLFMIRPSCLASFIRAVSDEYLPNPYHNFTHSVDVTQTVYYYIIKSNARDILSPLDVLCLITSAVCHDVGHPGQNNAFQINTQSDFARIYNDISVLESHHAAKTFEILRRKEYPPLEDCRDQQKMARYFSQKKNGDFVDNEDNLNILTTLTNNQFKEARKNIINMILMTDMSKHFEMTAKIAALVKNSEDSENTPLSPDNRDDRELLCAVLLHCADISNVTKPFQVSKKWADRVRDEFYEQGDLERVYGLPISPYMDREDSNQARTTLNFIDFVAAPLFTSISILLRGLEETCSNLADNRQKWQDILERQLSEPQPPIQPPPTKQTIQITQAPSTPTTKQESANTLSPDFVKKDKREMDMMAYRRRSVMVFQTINQADETARRRSGSKPAGSRLAPSSWQPGQHGSASTLSTLLEAKPEAETESNATKETSHVNTKESARPSVDSGSTLANQLLVQARVSDELQGSSAGGKSAQQTNAQSLNSGYLPTNSPSDVTMNESSVSLSDPDVKASKTDGTPNSSHIAYSPNRQNSTANGSTSPTPGTPSGPGKPTTPTNYKPAEAIMRSSSAGPTHAKSAARRSASALHGASSGISSANSRPRIGSLMGSPVVAGGLDGIVIGNGSNHQGLRIRPDSAGVISAYSHSPSQSPSPSSAMLQSSPATSNASGMQMTSHASWGSLSAPSAISAANASSQSATRPKSRAGSPFPSQGVHEVEMTYSIETNSSVVNIVRKPDKRSTPSLGIECINGKSLPPLRSAHKTKAG
eukprot:TRINITY_DN1867_c0_g2_i2.p1 TRINITY_DN1867_c0_g2~~TRINITY_DN1867_c0_g2_i2.p1  ORF type:complete len:1027 (+),score=219.56 TRINITY_DN1867_c0_g2_i2:68-3148(+)